MTPIKAVVLMWFIVAMILQLLGTLIILGQDKKLTIGGVLNMLFTVSFVWILGVLVHEGFFRGAP